MTAVGSVASKCEDCLVRANCSEACKEELVRGSKEYCERNKYMPSVSEKGEIQFIFTHLESGMQTIYVWNKNKNEIVKWL
jgi:hypothetical protein